MHKRRMAAFRLPLETIAQLDVLATELQRRSPGKVSQADAIAWAVARGVGELTTAEPAPTAPPPSMDRIALAPVEKEQAPAQRRRRAVGIGGELARIADGRIQPSDLDDNRKRAVEGTLRMFAEQDRSDRPVPEPEIVEPPKVVVCTTPMVVRPHYVTANPDKET